MLATRARESTILYVATHDLPFDDDARVDQVRHDPRAVRRTRDPAQHPRHRGRAAARHRDDRHRPGGGRIARHARAALPARGTPGRRRTGTGPPPSKHSARAAGATSPPTRRGARSSAACSTPESDGWEPARLLATVAAARELGSADSVAEVIAWRIDGFLADNPGPSASGVVTSPSLGQASGAAPASGFHPYENAATARERLAGIAADALGCRLAARAMSETAWPACIAALRRAENAGYDPAVALVVGRKRTGAPYRPKRQ